MDFKQLENLMKISESESISKASMELYITQSALNQQLLRLEEELGVRLFKRSKTGILPTEAGKVCLDYAMRLLALKKEMTDVMGDYADYKKGCIRIGLPTVRGFEMFSTIFPKFYAQYPGVKLEPLELPVKRQLFLLGKGSLDLSFVTLRQSDWSEDQFLPITDEEIFLILPSSHPLSQSAKTDQISLKQMEGEKFVLIYRDSTLRGLIDQLFQQNKCCPQIMLETSNHQTISNMVCGGYACALAPKLYISDPSAVRFFHLPERPVWQLCAAYKRGAYLSQPVKDFLNMAMSYWGGKETAADFIS